MTPQEIKSKAFDKIELVTVDWCTMDSKERIISILSQVDGIVLLAKEMLKDSENEKQKEGE